jgi:hypothetical protein
LGAAVLRVVVPKRGEKAGGKSCPKDVVGSGEANEIEGGRETMKEKFETRKFKAAQLEDIQRANLIIEEYQAQGFKLTVRQLYYQFVARDYCPNNERQYKRLADLFRNARFCGLMDWKAIEDRTRYTQGQHGWPDTPAEAITGVAWEFQYDLWKLTQNYRPLVWVEKDAALGVIERACEEWRVPFITGRGYSSITANYEIAKNFLLILEEGVLPMVIYIGDHDPSGINMLETLPTQLNVFANEMVEFRPIILTLDQVHHYALPPNEVKPKDPRAPEYIRQFGYECWELDALEPAVVKSLIDEAIGAEFDSDAWNAGLEREKEARKAIAALEDELVWFEPRTQVNRKSRELVREPLEDLESVRALLRSQGLLRNVVPINRRA